MKHFLTSTLLLLCCSCVQLGSDPQPMRYYLLQPNAQAEALSIDPEVNLTLEPIQFPTYLDQPQLTTHNDQQQVIIATLDRWAEPLPENVTRVLRENLSRHLQVAKTSQVTLKPDNQELSIKLTINNFDGILGQKLNVDIRWAIIATDRSKKLSQGRFTDDTPLGKKYSDLVIGLNGALNRISQKLAMEVTKLL